MLGTWVAARPESAALFFVALVFVLSRIVVYRFVPFKGLDPAFFQYIDLPLLRSDLLRSLFYLHSQPPLFNLFIGLVLKLFPAYSALVFRAVFMGLGLAMALCLFSLMQALGQRSTLSAIFTTLFIVSPACILYENWFYTTYPSAVLLCATVLSLNYYLAGRRPSTGICFIALLASLVLLNSTFQLIWMVATSLLMRFLAKEHLKRLDGAALAACLLLALLYVKNFAIFGTFTTSSWFGMNLARISTLQLDEQQRVRLISEGRLSPLALIEPLTGLDRYHGLVGPGRRTDIPVLDEVVKSCGAPNYNNLAYIGLSRRYLKDALFTITHYPSAYWRGVRSAVGIYLKPATEYFFLNRQLRGIAKWDRIYRSALIPFSIRKHRMLLLQALAFPGLWIFGAWLVFAEVGAEGRWTARSLTIVFILLSISYLTVVANGLELLENNRFRFVLDPLYLVLAGAFVGRCVEGLKRARGQPRD